MADIFDQLDGSAPTARRDIFDEVDLPSPKGDLFDAASAQPPPRGFVGEMGRQVGLTGRYILEGAPQLVDMVTAPLQYGTEKVMQQFDPEYRQMTYSGAGSALADAMGLPQPEGGGERIIAEASKAVAGGGPLNLVGGVLARGATPAAQAIGNFLTATPMTDAVMGAVGGLGYGTAQEAAPDSQAAQIIGGVAAPMAVGLGVNSLKGLGNYLGADNLAALFTGGDDVVRQVMAAGVNGVNEGQGRVAGRALGFLPSREAAAMQKATDDAAILLQTTAKSGGSIDEAVANLSAADEIRTSPDGASPGYRPTSGTVSGNMGLLGVEKGMSSEPAMVNRYANNRKAVNVETSQQMQPIGAPPRAAQNFIRGELDANVSQAEAAANQADQAALQAQRDLQTKQANIADSASESARTEPSAQIRESLVKQRNAVKAQVAEVFSRVPQGIVIDVKPESRKMADEIVKSYKGVVGGPPAAIVDFLEATKKGAITSGVAQKNLQELYAAAANAPEGSNTARLIGQLRDALDEDISKVEEFSQPLREARNFYRENFIPKYKSGEAFNVLYRRGAGGAPSVAPSETVGKFMGKTEDVKQLVSGLSGTSGKLSAADEAALEGWVVSNMSSKVKSMPTEERITGFVKENDAKLAAMPPRIKQRVLQIANEVGKAEKAVAGTKADLSAKQSALAGVKEQSTKSAIGKFARSKEPSYEVDSWLYGKDARARMNEVVSAAKRDKSGKALEGVKNAIKESLERKLKNPGSSSGTGLEVAAGNVDDWATSFAKASKILADDSPTRRAMKQVFSREELQDLDRVRKQLEVSSRINTKATAGSDTASLTQSKSQLQEVAEAVSGRGTRTNVAGASQLRTINTILETVKAVTQSSVVKGNYNELYKEVLNKAMLEPEIAKSLLRKPTPENLRRTSVLLKPIIRSTMQAASDEDSE